jgi:hypothetical protein
MSAAKEKPQSELPPSTEHWMVCPVCGERFDCRDLMKVLDHWHENDEAEMVVTFTIRGHEKSCRAIRQKDLGTYRPA